MCNKYQSQEMELIPEYETMFGEYESEYELFSETAPAITCAGLSADRKKMAINANRKSAKEIGWACFSAGKIEPIRELTAFLKLATPISEEDIACAVAAWQTTVKLPATGFINKRSWELMNIVPKLKYPLQSNVYYGGRKIGIMEKTSPYNTCYLAGRTCVPASSASAKAGAMEIELGFRITDMDAVKKAGFVDHLGNPKFRWIQTIETNHTLNQSTGMTIKKYNKYVDPNATPGLFDSNPYYWNEPGPGITYAPVTDYINRPSFGNLLCYDLIFYDRPSRALADAAPGKRVFWNGEVALVGVKKGNKNVLLNSFKWGFDIVINAAGKPEVKPNGMSVGPVGGSQLFRKTIDNAIRGGQFPGHCFIANGFTGKAVCK